MEHFILSAQDNFKIKVYVYGEYTKNFKAVIYIAHGKGEHRAYYEDLVKKLVLSSYIVVIHDHRGHGEYSDGSGTFKLNSYENNFMLMVHDLRVINSFIREKFQGKKVFMFGHSMGAWLLLRYAQIYGEKIDKLILSGIGIKSRIRFSLITSAVKILCVFTNSHKENKFFSSMFKRILSRKFKNLKVSSILTSDEKILNIYLNVKLRIKSYSLKFNYYLFSEIRKAVKISSFNKVNKYSKVLIIAGSNDPICFFKEGVVNLNKSFLMAGINSSCKIYENMRHNILAETNSHRVINDILKFLN